MILFLFLVLFDFDFNQKSSFGVKSEHFDYYFFIFIFQSQKHKILIKKIKVILEIKHEIKKYHRFFVNDNRFYECLKLIMVLYFFMYAMTFYSELLLRKFHSEIGVCL